jgi:hypothetical protein
MQASDSLRPTPLPARGVGGGFVLLLLFKTSVLALLSHHNICIADGSRLWLACLRRSSNEIEVESGDRID